jgi:hypothetical protein
LGDSLGKNAGERRGMGELHVFSSLSFNKVKSPSFICICLLWANTNLVSQNNKLRSIIKRSEDEAKVEDTHLSNARFIQKLKASFHCKQ